MVKTKFVQVAEGVFRDPQMDCFSVRLGRMVRYRDDAQPTEETPQK